MNPSFNYCPVCDADFAYYTMHIDCAKKYLLERYKWPYLVDALIAHVHHLGIEDGVTDTDIDEDIGENN